MNTRRFVLVAAVLTLAACAAGPDYAPTPSFEQVMASAPGPSIEKWWERLGDEALNAHIERALTHNHELAVARATVREASASRDAARAAFWPQLAADGGYTWAEQSINSPAGAGPLIGAGIVDRDVEFWSAGQSGRWDLDLFGGTRRLDQAARARVQQSIAQRDAVALGVVAETASAWLELRGAAARRQKIAENVALQQDTLTIIDKRVAIGLSRELDALRARGQLESTRSALPALDTAVQAAAWRLSVLTGESLDELPRAPTRLAPDTAFAPTLAKFPIAIEAGFLRERPDVAAAERNLAAAVAQLGVAQASFYPQLWVGASAGLESASVSSLTRGDSRVLGLAPKISLPVFQGGRLRAARRGALAAADAAYADLEQVLIAGLADAHTALAQVTGEAQTLAHVAASAQASREAEVIARGLYERGLGDFLSLLDAQRQRVQREDEQVQSATRAQLSLVRLFTALGGDARRLLSD